MDGTEDGADDAMLDGGEDTTFDGNADGIKDDKMDGCKDGWSVFISGFKVGNSLFSIGRNEGNCDGCTGDAVFNS